MFLFTWMTIRVTLGEGTLRFKSLQILMLLISYTLINYFMIRQLELVNFNHGRELITSFSSMLFVIVIAQFLGLFKRYSERALKTQLEKEILLRENADLELKTLKSQLEPHFFFNALNNLNSLIRTNPQKAIQYNEELSHVFRYLLTHKTLTFVPIEDELCFAKEFLSLNKHRFEHIEWEFIQRNANADSFIPAFTMQILLENIFKHNKISALSPINITIEHDHHSLTVRNSLNLKEHVVSTKYGLTSIKKAYDAHQVGHVEIRQTNDSYEVKLPLVIEPMADQ